MPASGGIATEFSTAADPQPRRAVMTYTSCILPQRGPGRRPVAAPVPDLPRAVNTLVAPATGGGDASHFRGMRLALGLAGLFVQYGREATAPDIYDAFLRGGIVVQKRRGQHRPHAPAHR